MQIVISNRDTNVIYVLNMYIPITRYNVESVLNQIYILKYDYVYIFHHMVHTSIQDTKIRINLNIIMR